MAAVTQIVPNFLGGVSKQTDQKKLPGQVRDCLNAYPDPTFGLMKRPGFKFIETIYPTSDPSATLSDGKWFFIKRDNLETYIGVILNKDVTNHASKPIRIWNKDGTECDVTFESSPADAKLYLDTTHDNYDVLTVQDKTIITNKDKICNTSSANPTGYVPGSYGTVRLLNIAYSNRYMLKVRVPSVHPTNFYGPNSFIGSTFVSDYVSSIKFIGNSENLVDADREEGNYSDIAATSTTNSSGGSGAKFNVRVNSSGGTTVSIKDRGTRYAKGDKFTFTDATLGGKDRIKTLNVTNQGDTNRTAGTYILENRSADDNTGTGAKITVYVANDSNKTATALVVDGGSNFDVGDTISIPSEDIGAANSGGTDLELTVSEIKKAKDLVVEVLDVEDDITDFIASQYYTINAEDHTPSTRETTSSDEKYLTAHRILKNLKEGLAATEIPASQGSTVSPYTWDIKQLDSTLEVSLKTSTGGGNSVATDLETYPDSSTGSGLRVDITSVDSDNKVTGIAINTDTTTGTGYAVNDVVRISQASSNCGVKITAVSTVDINGTPTAGVPTAIEIDAFIPFELIASDNQGNFSIAAFNEEVASVADLPAQTTHGRIVKVVNSGPAETSYWSKFVAEDGVSGKGYWEETIDPTVSTGLDKSTMPHELYNDEPDSFIFRQADWSSRTVGDDLTNANPGFVSRKIQQCFYHNNRLGILTEDNVVMSKTSDFFNFYYTSALTITDNDPIDINCSSLRPAVLHGVLPTAQGLILFSQNQQFIMFADAEVLTPTSAVIRGIANYEMDPKIDPVETGTLINFVSKTPNSTRVFSIQPRGSDDSPNILDIGKIVSGWIPQTTKNLISSPANSLIALYGDNTDVGSPTMYIYKTYVVGDRMVMQAWVKWDLPGNIQHISIDTDVMYAVVENNGKYVLCSTNLTEAPDETILTTADGQRVNPYMDLYSKAQNGTNPNANGYKTVVYDAAGDFSKCYIPYADLTELNPVILIAGDADEGFAGVTESGFTINPTRVEDGSDVYFKVPGKDLSGQADNVYVGYQYNYDVELPKTYFKLNPEGTQYDYTASLTVARMKFALGLSSVCSFKVKSKGYRGPLDEFTGDGLTTTFSVPFLLKEENGIKVTLDGAEQDSDTYSVARTVVTDENDVSHTVDSSDTVTFDTPPSGITAKQYYKGTGYPTAGYSVATTGGSGTGLTVDFFTSTYTKTTSDQTGTAITANAMSSSSPYSGQSDRDEQIYEYCWTGFNPGGAPTTNSPYFCLDVDGDGIVSPTDAIIFLRYLTGPAFNGDALINDLPISDNAARKTADDIRAFIDNHKANTTIARGTYNGSDIGNKNVYDIDANGSSTALGEGVMVVRIFGGALNSGGTVSQTSGFLNPHDGGPAVWDSQVKAWTFDVDDHIVTRNQGSGYKPNDVITIVRGDESNSDPDDAIFLIDKLGDKIEITTDTWYDTQPSSDAGQYLADDVPLVEENIFTIPLHQRSENFNMRVFSNSPFPVSLTSMMWEGQYSPRFYRRT